MAQLDLATFPARAIHERTALRRIDPVLGASAIALALTGLAMIYSATNKTLTTLNENPGFYLKKQAVYLVVGLVAMAAAAIVDYRVAKVYAPFIYVGCVGLLLLVQTPLGRVAKGAQRAFQVAGFQLSPSLFTRLGLIAMLAAYLSEIKGELDLRHVIRATSIAAVPMLLVFIQPDIGTTIILSAILVALLVASGAGAKYLVVLAVVGSLAIFGAFQLHIIKDYQVQRITSFLDPQSDVQRGNYNKQQAEIAIGSGGLIGKGYLHGTQTNLDYVPEQHTDFIFTVVGEELGFLRGTVPLLFLFGILLWRAFRIALLSKDPFGTFVAAGVFAMIAIQVFVNVGMTIGIMPITGIPLPFISYGGSALIADFIGIGLLQGIHLRRSL
ncbi:MAG: rod shape-determining protein RodA [Actinobacteria bacterium]|nr:MAG: rod shape-determining protein RodA [Actinomycetota bacterium]